MTYAIATAHIRALDLTWVILGLLILVSGFFTVRVPSAPSRMSVSETFVIIAAVLYGPGPAAILAAGDALFVSVWNLKNRKDFYRIFFNIATASVSTFVSARLFFLLAEQPLALGTPRSVIVIIPALLLFAAVYFLLNGWLVALAVGLSTKQSPLVVWKKGFLLLSLNYVSGASLAALLLPFISTLGPWSIVLVAPLMVLAYTTFWTSMGRVADTNNHLTELNKMYLSTIETLAMAIDAKDQITHGHVRRVQAYAIGLAKKVGLTSEPELKAIEAAALLHDMGKLAIPEHILNKPGKLTKTEFETIKRHAKIGADMLSSIDFPYPVVPIVLHHHENWDGNGYPSELRGEAIPVGARILAVVDCFDALTSDRPYRPRLPDSEALEILRERAGKMYDPNLVETFAAVYQDIAPKEARRPADMSRAEALGEDPEEAQGRGRSTRNSTPPGGRESRILHELAEGLASKNSLPDLARLISSTLRRALPVSTLVLFIYDPAADELVARQAFGSHAGLVMGLHIAMGERVSGWVAANRQTVVNSHPVLDLGDIARNRSPRLKSCLAAAIEAPHSIVGVVTVYSDQEHAFSSDHQRVLESVTKRVAVPLSRHLPSEQQASDAISGSTMSLHHRELEKSFVLQKGFGTQSCQSLVLVSLGEEQTAGTLEAVATVKSCLRSSDRVYPLGERELAIVLPETGRGLCVSVAGDIDAALCSDSVSFAAACGFACAPEDGLSVSDLLQVARGRLPNRDNRRDDLRNRCPPVH